MSPGALFLYILCAGGALIALGVAGLVLWVAFNVWADSIHRKAGG